MTEKIELTKDGGIARLLMDNPPANVWTEKTLTELIDVVKALNADTQVRALILSGRGEKFFSAGADLKAFAAADEGRAFELAILFGRAFETLSNFRGVSIAAINGYAMGGGLEVALACDIRLCVSGAKMALPEARVGLLPCGGGTQNLTAAVGEGWAKRMILCGETIDAATAQRIGLVEEVAEMTTLHERAQALAAGVTQQSPTSQTYCKRLIQMGRHRPRWQVLIEEREMFVKLWRDGNRKEGCEAFLQKRAPQWRYE